MHDNIKRDFVAAFMRTSLHLRVSVKLHLMCWTRSSQCTSRAVAQCVASDIVITLMIQSQKVLPFITFTKHTNMRTKMPFHARVEFHGISQICLSS
jgi:hypothetical protein